MNKKKCPLCGAVKTKKNGTRKGVQLYKSLVYYVTDRVFGLLRGSPSRILRNPKQRDF